MAHSKTFYLQDGKVFSSLEKFAKELQSMADEVFKHHVNDEKHDFREWIKHSLKEEELANKIDAKIDKLELELEVLRHLVHEQKAKTKAPITKKEKTAKKTSPPTTTNTTTKVKTQKVATAKPKKEVVKKEKVAKKVTPEKKSKTTKTKEAKK